MALAGLSIRSFNGAKKSSDADLAALKELASSMTSSNASAMLPSLAAMSFRQQQKLFGRDAFLMLTSASEPSLLLFRADPLGVRSLREWHEALMRRVDALLLQGRPVDLTKLIGSIVDFPSDINLAIDGRRLVKDGLLRIWTPIAQNWAYAQVFKKEKKNFFFFVAFIQFFA